MHIHKSIWMLLVASMISFNLEAPSKKSKRHAKASEAAAVKNDGCIVMKTESEWRSILFGPLNILVCCSSSDGSVRLFGVRNLYNLIKHLTTLLRIMGENGAIESRAECCTNLKEAIGLLGEIYQGIAACSAFSNKGASTALEAVCRALARLDGLLRLGDVPESVRSQGKDVRSNILKICSNLIHKAEEITPLAIEAQKSLFWGSENGSASSSGQSATEIGELCSQSLRALAEYVAGFWLALPSSKKRGFKEEVRQGMAYFVNIGRRVQDKGLCVSIEEKEVLTRYRASINTVMERLFTHRATGVFSCYLNCLYELMALVEKRDAVLWDALLLNAHEELLPLFTLLNRADFSETMPSIELAKNTFAVLQHAAGFINQWSKLGGAAGKAFHGVTLDLFAPGVEEIFQSYQACALDATKDSAKPSAISSPVLSSSSTDAASSRRSSGDECEPCADAASRLEGLLVSKKDGEWFHIDEIDPELKLSEKFSVFCESLSEKSFRDCVDVYKKAFEALDRVRGIADERFVPLMVLKAYVEALMSEGVMESTSLKEGDRLSMYNKIMGTNYAKVPDLEQGLVVIIKRMCFMDTRDDVDACVAWCVAERCFAARKKLAPGHLIEACKCDVCGARPKAPNPSLGTASM